MTRLYFSLFSILFTLIGQAQQRVFTGKVTDSRSGIPLQGVSVSCNKGGLTTNSNGYFHFTADSAAGSTLSLSFSYVGYKTKTITAAANNFIIVSLEAATTPLDEVIVVTGAENIIKRAIQHIPDNYPLHKFTATGILRVYRTETDSPRIFRFFKSDAVIAVHYPSYADTATPAKTSVLQNKNIFLKPHQPPYDTSIWTGSYIIDDFVHKRSDFINPENLNEFRYRITGKTILQGAVVWIIAFEKKGLTKTSGTLYIDTSSYAFAGAQYTKYNVRRLRHRTIENAGYYILFSKNGNKWYPSQISQKTIFSFSKARLGAVKDFICTAIAADTGAVSQSSKNFIKPYDEDNKITVWAADSHWKQFDSLFNKAEQQNSIHYFPLPQKEDVSDTGAGIDEEIPFYKRKTYLEETRIRIFLSAEYLNIRSSGNSRGATGIGFGAGIRLLPRTYFQLHTAINFKDSNSIYTSKLGFELLHSVNVSNSGHPFYITPALGFNIVELTTKQQKYQKILQWSAGLGVSYPVIPKVRIFGSFMFTNTIKSTGILASFFSRPFSFSSGAFFTF